MDKNKLLKYSVIDKVLKQHRFFGFTVSRNGNKYIHTYRSISYYAVLITVTTLKVEGKQIVLGVDFSGNEVSDFKEFMESLKNIGKLHHKEAN